MNASVAPISLEISISARWVRICRRMVLKVMATKPKASSPANSRMASRADAASAPRQRAQLRRQRFQRRGVGGIGGPRPQHERIGQRIAVQRRDHFGQAFAGLQFLEGLLAWHETQLAYARIGFQARDERLGVCAWYFG